MSGPETDLLRPELHGIPEGWGTLHLVGVGGAGMSGVARLLLARGLRVTGSDLKDSANVEALRRAGAEVHVGHAAARLGKPDAVVISSAIPPSNPEVVRAGELGIPVLSRAQILAALMRGKRSVAVAGTHGKTTTTSMISVMLSRTGRAPSFVIGGDLNESGSGAEHGRGDVFVAEADESDGSFLILGPDIAVVTNVEEDHLDFYAGREEIEQAFASFVEGAAAVVACWDDPGARRAVELAEASRSVRRTSNGNPSPALLRYGFGEDADLILRDVELGLGGARATLHCGDRRVQLALPVPGRHNLLNAAAAMGVAVLLEVPWDPAAEALASFAGVRRRFEARGSVAGATFVDDYAHHPTEVGATLRAACEQGYRRVVAVFQPHRYSRTEAMWRALGESLRPADVVVLTDVYSAGETPIPGITGKLLADALTEAAPGKRVIYLPKRSDIPTFLAGQVRDGDLVITLGAGDITTTADEVIGRIREGHR